ncbi:hypothetical protein D3C72_2019240 [compost metagenome]
MNAGLFLRHLLELGSKLAGEESAHMRGVAEEIGRRQHGPLRHLLGNVLRGNIAHLQIAAL